MEKRALGRGLAALIPEKQIVGNAQTSEYNIQQGIINIPIEKIKMAPKTREMDLSQMRAIHFFAINLDKEFSLYIGNIILK